MGHEMILCAAFTVQFLYRDFNDGSDFRLLVDNLLKSLVSLAVLTVALDYYG